MATIVRNDRGKVLARISKSGSYIKLSVVKRWTPVEAYKVATELAAFAGAGTEESSGEKRPPSRPPLHGPGSSRDEWAAYAQSHGIEVNDGMTRSDIVNAVIVAERDVA